MVGSFHKVIFFWTIDCHYELFQKSFNHNLSMNFAPNGVLIVLCSLKRKRSHHFIVYSLHRVVTCHFFYIPVSSIVVGVLIFTTNHMKLDEDTMVSNNMGMFQMSISKVSWACWLSASATPSAVMTVLFLALNIVFFWIRQLSNSECFISHVHVHVSFDLINSVIMIPKCHSLVKIY